jgi:hypothetical protein
MTNKDKICELIAKMKKGEVIRIWDDGYRNRLTIRYWYKKGNFYTSTDDGFTDIDEIQEFNISEQRLISELGMMLANPGRYRIFKRYD